ncbi:MAG TPA: Ig-like domain-containing protein [Abditibacteriaceae bacterium]
MALAALAATSTVAQAVPPVAANDFFTVTQTETNISLNVLGNDFDPDGTALSVNSVSAGNQGGVTIDNDGNITYTPAFTFSGTETFSYTAIDANGEVSNVATVTVTILPPPSTFNSAITGNGSLEGQRKVRKRANTTFTAYNSNNLSGEVVFRDPVSRLTFRSTRITAVQAFGNTGRIFGFGTFNGFDEVGFVLTTVDQFPTYVTRGDSFSLQIGTNFAFSSIFNPGGSRVVGGFGEVINPVPLANR